MEIEVLSAALVLVASLCGGLSCVFIARSRSSINKHSRQRIKDFENDIKYLAESKKEEAKDYRQEILRLKGTLNKMKQGVTVTESDIKNSGGVGEMLMTKFIPQKYHAIVKPLLPKAEAYLAEHSEEIIDKIKSANTTSNKQTEPGSQTEAVQTL